MENYIKEFYKNTDPDKYSKFFKPIEDCNIQQRKKELQTSIEKMEQARENLEKEYAKIYEGSYTPISKPHLFAYTKRNTNSQRYYDITGMLVNNPDTDEYIIRTLDTKHGSISVLDGYCYELASLIVKKYDYSIATNDGSCKFTFLTESIVPFFDSMHEYNRNGTITKMGDGRWYYWQAAASSYLKKYDATEFINTLYGVERESYPATLGDMAQYATKNKSFEIIIKTAPESLLKRLLEMEVNEATPIPKLLGLSQQMYNKAVELDMCNEFYELRKFISNKEVFHKTEEEWLEMIKDYVLKEADLKFFHITYTSYYMREAYSSCQLLGFLADKYATKQSLNSNYTFGKFCNYVVEETINQGYTDLTNFVSELIDYIDMCKTLNAKPTLYSSYLKQTHDIASRNHKVYLDIHQEEIFANVYKDDKQQKFKVEEEEYFVVPPKTSNEVKLEGDALNHCVASYLKRILDGQTKILFLRKDPLVSLITMEVRDGKICQCRGQHNRRPDEIEDKVIKLYAKKNNLQVTY